MSVPVLKATLLSWLLLALAATACLAQSEPERVRGILIRVDASSLARADSVTLQADDGRVMTFRVDPEVAVPPGHLREHMAFGEPVLIEYVRQPDGLLAVRIDDG